MDILISKKKKIPKAKLKELGLDGVFFLTPENSAILDYDDKEELRRKVSSAHSKGKIIVIQGSNDEINRIAVSDKRVSILLSPERKRKQDYMHVRNSGLNHVLCDLARKNDVAIGINYSELKKLSSKERADRLGRISQYIKICRKRKASIILASFGSSPNSIYDLRSFGFSLGMSSDQLKSALEKAKDIFNNKI